MTVTAIHQGKPSAVVKRNVLISGRNTCVHLEDEFWHALREIAVAKDTTRPRLIAQIKQNKPPNLSSAIRLFVLAYYQDLGIGNC
jgi:predicted DNA-binding ribbon-helix-helix protein